MNLMFCLNFYVVLCLKFLNLITSFGLSAGDKCSLSLAAGVELVAASRIAVIIPGFVSLLIRLHLSASIVALVGSYFAGTSSDSSGFLVLDRIKSPPNFTLCL